MEKTAIEWLDNQIDDELKVIDNLYGKEIMGRKIGLAFVKRILVQAKEMEKEQSMYSEEDLRNAYRWGTTVNHGTKEHFNEWFEQFKKK